MKNIKSINKSYGQMNKEEKEYIVSVYYKYKDKTVKELIFRFYQLFYKESTIYLDRKKTKWDEVMSALM